MQTRYLLYSRLKLKCDKTIPCSSCMRRGCASICPNGSLVTGQGTRFVLADTDRLHNKITEMSARIRQLEDGLAMSHSGVSRDPHPLLQRDLLQIKSIIDLHSAVDQSIEDDGTTEPDGNRVLDTFGMLALRDDGASTFYGRSAGHESERDSLVGKSSYPAGGGEDHSHPSILGDTSTPPDLPPPILEVSASFPDSSVRLPLYVLEAYLPPWSRATQLCTLYLEQAPWFFGAVKARQLHEEILPLYYVEARPYGVSPPSSSTAHDLALLFVIFCFGSVTDDNLPPAPGNAEADRFYTLTRAAIALTPPMDRPPTLSTVQAFSLMAIYQGIVANQDSIENTWTMMGLATKLAQSIDRDCARWNLAPSETQKRRALFWELFITDCWQSLATGRLPTFSLPFVDCELPQDLEQLLAADGTPQVSFPHWKAQFGKHCVSEVVAGILTARPPKYSVVLELDRKIRDMELPQYAVEPLPEGAPFSVIMQHFMPSNYRCLTLLYIHRAFFAQGLCDQPIDPLRGTYAPSIFSGYRSACQILSNLRAAFTSVMLALVPVRAPRSKMAHDALRELRSSYELFDHAASFGGRAVKMLPIVKRHLDKAEQSFNAAHTAIEPFAAPIRDEFALFSGMTSTVRVVTSTPPSLPRSNHESLTDPSPNVPHNETPHAASEIASKPPQPTVPQTPSCTDIESSPWSQVHPALIDQLVSFEAQSEPSSVVDPYIYEQTASPHTTRTPFPFPASTRPPSPSMLSYPQQTPRGHPCPPDHSEDLPLPSTISDTSVADTRRGAPHAATQPQFARPCAHPGSLPRDAVLRQSGNLSLTEAWSQFVMQMDIPPGTPQRP
ncbi:fungal-specific transcription factor domain-containing protein [Russula earlei]|uniref:Fungal-specific transcription factor domain-containing protein n=1 Tax=Russula earlei TaxID=71964 RepID=A0ACC0TVE1_9AGAM|nr:fungal-specific transcription factor domain-containing protein [Russula earlei]